MPDPNFTPEAYDALRHASWEAERLSDPLVTPEHLLLALLRGKETGAVRVLAHFRVASPPLIARLERYVSWADCPEQAAIRTAHARKADDPHGGHLLPRMGSILDHAAAEARRHGRPAIGTEHLLYGIVSECGSLAAWLLHQWGLTPTLLSADLAARLPEASATGRFRMAATAAQLRAVNAVTGVALLGFMWALVALLLLVGLLEDRPSGAFWPSLLRSLWAAGLALGSVRAGMTLERRVWPRLTALLFVSSAGGAVLLTAILTGLLPEFARLGWPLAFYLPIVLWTASNLFQTRAVFGIEARQGWRVLWREGGSYLVCTAVLELATLAGYLRNR